VDGGAGGGGARAGGAPEDKVQPAGLVPHLLSFVPKGKCKKYKKKEYKEKNLGYLRPKYLSQEYFFKIKSKKKYFKNQERKI
jgi:hypothetical protein